MKEAHHQDGVVMVRILKYLEENFDKGLTEWDIVKLLQTEREKESLFKDMSFDSVVGYGSNGAIVHYKP